MDQVDRVENNNIKGFRKALRRFDIVESLDRRKRSVYKQELETRWGLKWDDMFTYFSGVISEPERECQHREALLKKWYLTTENVWELLHIYTSGQTLDLRREFFNGLWDALFQVYFHHALETQKYQKVRRIYLESDATDFGNLPVPAISGNIKDRSQIRNNIEFYFAAPQSGRVFYKALYGNREKKNIFRTYTERITRDFFVPEKLNGFWDFILLDDLSDIMDCWLLLNSLDSTLIRSVYRHRSKHRQRYKDDKGITKVICQCRWPYMRQFLGEWFYQPRLSEGEITKTTWKNMENYLQEQVAIVNRVFYLLTSLLWDAIQDREWGSMNGEEIAARQKERMTVLRKANSKEIEDKALFANIAYEVITLLKKGRETVLEVFSHLGDEETIENIEIAPEILFNQEQLFRRGN